MNIGKTTHSWVSDGIRMLWVSLENSQNLSKVDVSRGMSNIWYNVGPRVATLRLSVNIK